MTDIALIPLADIDPAALPRDRSGLDPEPLAELKSSIAANGLRMPIEVFAAEGAPPYGLLSGYHRHWAFTELFEATRDPRWSAIPAFVRPATDLPQALAAMVEENEIRAPISPWEQGRIALLAWRRDIFPTVEEAVAALYPHANKVRRSRIHSIARLVERMDDYLLAPERLTQRQCLRLAAAVQNGFDMVIQTALEECSVPRPEVQWSLILPIIAESELGEDEGRPQRPGRPRRLLTVRESIVIRREKTRDGYCLHFTGREATSTLLDLVFDEIENLFGPG